MSLRQAWVRSVSQDGCNIDMWVGTSYIKHAVDWEILNVQWSF